MGHSDSAEDGVAECDGVVGDVEDGDAMVEEEGVSDDGESDFFIAKLSDGVEITDLAIEAIGGIAVPDGLIEAPGHSSRDGACVGEDGEFAFLSGQAETSKGGNCGGWAAGEIGGLRTDVVVIDSGFDVSEGVLNQGWYKEWQDGAVDNDSCNECEDDGFFDTIFEPAKECHSSHRGGEADDDETHTAAGDPGEGRDEGFQGDIG